MKLVRNILKWLATTIAGLGVLVLVVRFVILGIFSLQLKGSLRQLKANGRPMTIEEIRPVPVPDQDNAAIVYHRIFALMTSGQGGKTYVPGKEPGQCNRICNTIISVDSCSDMSGWSRKEKTEIPRLIKSGQIQTIYRLTTEAVSKPGCDFNLNYQAGPEMLMPHLGRMRNLVRILAVKALVEAGSGDLNRALETICTGLRISNHLEGQPELISQLVRVADDAIMLDCLQGIVRGQEISGDKARFITEELSNRADPSPFVRALDAERAIYGQWMQSQGSSILAAMICMQEWPVKEKIPDWLLQVMGWLWEPVTRKDLAVYFGLLARLQALYSLPYYQFQQEIKRVPIVIPGYCLICRTCLTGLEKIPGCIARHQANIDLGRTALALKLHRKEKGAWPQSLEELSPAFLGEVPVDPFSGQIFIYRRLPKGFLLYSVGLDGKDDSGTRQKPGQDKAYDLVWLD